MINLTSSVDKLKKAELDYKEALDELDNNLSMKYKEVRECLGTMKYDGCNFFSLIDQLHTKDINFYSSYETLKDFDAIDDDTFFLNCFTSDGDIIYYDNDFRMIFYKEWFDMDAEDIAKEIFELAKIKYEAFKKVVKINQKKKEDNEYALYLQLKDKFENQAGDC